MENSNYLSDVKKQFHSYKSLAENAINQVGENRINWYFHNDSNSIAILVKHISGNLLSRFTDFMTSDGEKEWRNRDDEFVDDIITKSDMNAVWEKGWACLFDCLDALRESDLDKIVLIRGEKHTVVEALNRQMTHHAYHVGQIVFLSKMLSTEWQSLSIPKGESLAFNQAINP